MDADETTGMERRLLPFVPGKLAEWLPNAKAVGPMIDGDLPLFLMPRALDLSRESLRNNQTLSRSGGVNTPARCIRRLSTTNPALVRSAAWRSNFAP